MTIRPYQPSDLESLRAMTIEGFDGTAIDQAVEREFGLLAGQDWRSRKAQHVNDDVEANPSGVFVAVEGEEVLGYISTRVDSFAKKGRIPNLAVIKAAQGRGIGRQLIAHAVEALRAQGMAFVMIETMANNEVGQHLYPSCGFIPVAQQTHFVMKL